MKAPGGPCVWWKNTKWCSCGHKLKEATRTAWESHAKLRKNRLSQKGKAAGEALRWSKRKSPKKG